MTFSEKGMSIMNEYSEAMTEINPPVQESKLSRVLRYLGGIVLSASAGTFLVQSWMSWDGGGRIYAFMGFILTLFACGVFTGIKWREDKVARVFLGIATAVLTASFFQVGALAYSYLNHTMAQIKKM